MKITLQIENSTKFSWNYENLFNSWEIVRNSVAIVEIDLTIRKWKKISDKTKKRVSNLNKIIEVTPTVRKC